jgi:hemerythrin
MFKGNEKIDELDSQHSYIFEILKNKTVTSYEDSKEGHERVSTSQTALLLRLSNTEENFNKY